MKKKILAVSLVIVLLAIAIVGGTLAWFTDTDEVENVFTIGSIKIQQHEQQHDENGELEDFEQKQMLLPVVNTENPAEDENYIEKIVTVENTGKNAAYVRSFIAIPKALMGYLCIDTKEDNWTWCHMSEVTVGETAYVVFGYYYNAPLASGETTDVLLEGVYLDAKVDIKDNPDTEEVDLQLCIWNEYEQKYDFSGYLVNENTEVNVLVATQACQVEGFGGTPIQEVLDTAFGTDVSDLFNAG